ncbi:hypothetical protein ACFWDG_24070 [Peribacillus sp. NPDC060186]
MDLAIGFFDLDKQKYNLLVNTTFEDYRSLGTAWSRRYIRKNKTNLERYKDILITIEAGNIILGRLDRINRKSGDIK